jgi:hypothetical protein
MMSPDLNADEREVVKLVGFFKKKAEQLANENKLEHSYTALMETCDKFVDQIGLHAGSRKLIRDQQEQLNKLVKDNARCPNCEKSDMLKQVGVDTNEQGWKNNKYKCRRCNIEFVWNIPNNPYDMIAYVEYLSAKMEAEIREGKLSETAKLQTEMALEQMKGNLDRLKPVVDAVRNDIIALEEREREMSVLVEKFKKHLMIEKIRLDM